MNPTLEAANLEFLSPGRDLHADHAWDAHGPLRVVRPGAAVRVEDLSVSYCGRPVLGDVSVDIKDGGITALIGPSGCGKTTFLSCLNRMIDMVPTSQVRGSVKMGGVNIFHSSVEVLMLRRHVGMVFQKPNPFPLSIRKNLELPLLEVGVRNKRELADRVEAALTDVGLWKEVKDQLGKSALSLSGGQQQRLCIARAIILEPTVLLLDEPCSALDPISSGTVEDLIVQMRGRYTVLIVTHNLAQARRVADDVGVFWVQNGQGALIEFGSSSQVFGSPKHLITAEYILGVRG